MSRSSIAIGVSVRVIGIALGVMLVAMSPASARRRTRPHAMPRDPVVATPAAPTPYSYYPENIKGGVPGNLPFNNQLRKLSYPLNANGAGR